MPREYGMRILLWKDRLDASLGRIAPIILRAAFGADGLPGQGQRSVYMECDRSQSYMTVKD